MKKLISNFFSLTFLLLIIVSCQKKDSDLDVSTTENTSIDNTTTDDLGNVWPEVYSVLPADNSFLIGVKTSVSITFSRRMEEKSITTNTVSNSCSGTIQLSFDNFSTCLRMSAGPLASNGNYSFTVDPIKDLLYSTNYKIRVTNAAKDRQGMNLKNTYTSPKGFTTVPLSNKSNATTIYCRTRPLKANPTIQSLDLFANNSTNFTGLELNWLPLSGAASYGVEIDLLSVNKYFSEIDNLSCTGINLQLDSSVSSLYRSGCNWRGPYFSPYTKHGFTVNAYDVNGNKISTSTDNATVGVNKSAPPSEVWGTAGNTEVSLEWNPVLGATGYRIYQIKSGSYTDITPSEQGTLSKATVTGLTNLDEYEFRIRSVSLDGTSDLSNPVKITPLYGRDIFLTKYNSLGIKQWTKQSGTSSDDKAYGVATDSKGNVFVAGHTYGGFEEINNIGMSDIFLIKFDSSGSKKWTTQVGTSALDLVSDITTDNNGNIYITGSTDGALEGSNNSGSRDGFLIKYDSRGSAKWMTQFGTTTVDMAKEVASDLSGNIFIVGHTMGSLEGNDNAGLYDLFLLKYDSSGVKKWTVQLGSTSVDYADGVSVSSNGDIYITGYTEGSLEGLNSGEYDLFLAKFNSLGTKQWVNQLGTPSGDYGKDVSIDSYGNIYVTGYTRGGLDNNTSSGGDDFFVIKFDSLGTKLWTDQSGTTGTDRAYGITHDISGNAFLAGYTYGGLDGKTNAGRSDTILIKYNSTGTKQWTKQLGTKESDWATRITNDKSGNIYITGITQGGLDGNKNAGMQSVRLEFDNVTVNQAVQMDFSEKNQLKLISEKPGIIRAFFKLSGNISGYLGTIRLSGAGTISSVSPITQTIALYDTPKETADESNCVATFDLRNVAYSWFKPGAEIVLETNAGTLIDPSDSSYVRYPSTDSQKLTVVDQEPLYIKLVPLKTDKGTLTSDEMNDSKEKIQALMNSMYPNSSINFVVSSSALDLTKNDNLGRLVSDKDFRKALDDFQDYRELELNNTNCNRFYYGLIKYDDEVDYDWGGMAKIPSSTEKGSCPSLVGIGLNNKNVARIAAHEVGHNSGRRHADNSGEVNDKCSDPLNTDFSYPYQYGRIGMMGYDSYSNSLKSKYFYHDIMSYCSQRWISDYTYVALQKFQETLNKNIAGTVTRSEKHLTASVDKGGILISGIKNTDGVWVINSILGLGGSRSQPTNPTHFMTVQAHSGLSFSLGFNLEWFDHILDRPFSVWVPTSESLKILKIFNSDGDLLYTKDLPELRQSEQRIERSKLKEISEGLWQLSPSNLGSRIVILIKNSERKFLGNGGDNKPFNVEAIKGDKLEVHYPDIGAKKILIVE